MATVQAEIRKTHNSIKKTIIANITNTTVDNSMTCHSIVGNATIGNSMTCHSIIGNSTRVRKEMCFEVRLGGIFRQKWSETERVFFGKEGYCTEMSR